MIYSFRSETVRQPCEYPLDNGRTFFPCAGLQTNRANGLWHLRIWVHYTFKHVSGKNETVHMDRWQRHWYNSGTAAVEVT